MPLDQTVRKLPAVEQRVETGPVQFGEDWPGLFIRGDAAIFFAMHLRTLLDIKTSDPEWYFSKQVVLELLSDLESSKITEDSNDHHSV